jgi:hypothetical protein
MANYQIGLNVVVLEVLIPLPRCANCLILFVHLVVTVARLAMPGGLRSVVAESVAGSGRGRDITYPVLVKILVGSLRSCLRKYLTLFAAKA